MRTGVSMGYTLNDTAQAPALSARSCSAATQTHEQPVRSYQACFEHLATLTRADLRYGTDPTLPTVPTLTEPTPAG